MKAHEILALSDALNVLNSQAVTDVIATAIDGIEAVICDELKTAPIATLELIAKATGSNSLRLACETRIIELLSNRVARARQNVTTSRYELGDDWSQTSQGQVLLQDYNAANSALTSYIDNLLK